MAWSVRPLYGTSSLTFVTPKADRRAPSIAALPAPPLRIRVPSMSNRITVMGIVVRPAPVPGGRRPGFRG